MYKKYIFRGLHISHPKCIYSKIRNHVKKKSINKLKEEIFSNISVFKMCIQMWNF